MATGVVSSAVLGRRRCTKAAMAVMAVFCEAQEWGQKTGPKIGCADSGLSCTMLSFWESLKTTKVGAFASSSEASVVECVRVGAPCH